MKNLVEKIKAYFERHAFGVCESLGEHMHIKSADIRLFFIYTSFLTAGSPIIIYLILAFLKKLKHLVKKPRGSVWDL